MNGLRIAFIASLLMCLVAAAASWLRGGRYVAKGSEGEPVPVGAFGAPIEPGLHGDEAPEPEEWVPA
jgi:hypothetical protein